MSDERGLNYKGRMLKKPGKSRLRKPPLKLKEMTGQRDEAIKAQLPVCPLATGVNREIPTLHITQH